MSHQEIGQYREYIRDKFIWRYIFGNQDPELDNADDILRCINNTVNLAFIYVLSCIRGMYKNEENIEDKKKTFNPNAKRAIKNMDRIYNGLDITYELINYILLDVQFDLSLGNSSCLKQYIPGVSDTFLPLDYSPLILHWLSSSRAISGMTLDDLIRRFQKLIVSLPFLGASLTEEDADVCFEVRVGFEKSWLYTDHKILIRDCGRDYYMFYFLERVETDNHACTLHYSTPDYADKYEIVCHDEHYRGETENSENRVFRQMEIDDLEMLYSCITGSDPESLFQEKIGHEDGIRNIYSVNYKYLKNLSLAIADELGSVDRTKCREDFLAKYGVDATKESDLDSVIIMKLIEHTPTTILNDLFIIDSDLFHAIIRNLYRRFNGRVVFRHVDFSVQPPDFTALEKFIQNSMHAGRKFIREGERAMLQANYIISMILSDSMSSMPIADNIGRIQAHNELAFAQGTLAKILMRTCVFYQGVLAYGKGKLAYDAEHYNSMPSAEETAKAQILLHDAFLKKAQKAYNTEFRDSFESMDPKSQLLYALQRLHALMDLCEKPENERYLKCAIGKTEIMDHDGISLTDALTEMEPKDQIRQIVNCLEYLNTGSLENNEGQGDFNSCIYPTTGKYRSNSESGDECRVACFSVRIDVNANGKYDYIKNIKVLTEFTYQINEYYYCLPNIARSNINWWIDPLIIKAGDFDAIFKQGE